MAKAKRKKESEFNKQMVKSVFLSGRPNTEKRNKLVKIQTDYTKAVNDFTLLIDEEPDMVLPVVKNDHKAPKARAFEKSHRLPFLTSAYSQSAFDMAMDHLHNRMTDIRHEMYSVMPCALTSSKLLFAAAVTGHDRVYMISLMEEMEHKAVKDKAFYTDMKNKLDTMSENEFHVQMQEFTVLYRLLAEEYKLPYVGKARVRLVSTIHKLEESSDIKTPYVVSITDPEKRGHMLTVPLSLSGDAKRRLHQYGKAGTIDYTVTDAGVLRVSVAFKKNLMKPEVKTYRGVDVGITDMLYASDGTKTGTFTDCEAFYKTEVEPAFACVNSIRNKKKALRTFLRRHKDTVPSEVKKVIRDKMDRLDVMLQGMKKPYRKRNHYYAMQDKAICDAVQKYIKSLNGDRSICTAMELLDVKEFDEVSKHRNQHLSMFARGKLSMKLMEKLNWNGFAFKQVDPAFTSQICPVCFNLDKNSRNGKLFKCTYCGHTDDADHNGSVNIETRAEDTELEKLVETHKYSQTKRHAAIINLYKNRHEAYKRQELSPAM